MIDIDETDVVHNIDETIAIEFEGKTLFRYDAETQTLAINIDKEFLLDIGSIPVDLCFPVPGRPREHYCFKQVSRVIRLEQKGLGLIQRFTRFIRRK